MQASSSLNNREELVNYEEEDDLIDIDSLLKDDTLMSISPWITFLTQCVYVLFLFILPSLYFLTLFVLCKYHSWYCHLIYYFGFRFWIYNFHYFNMFIYSIFSFFFCCYLSHNLVVVLGYSLGYIFVFVFKKNKLCVIFF